MFQNVLEVDAVVVRCSEHKYLFHVHEDCEVLI